VIHCFTEENQELQSAHGPKKAGKILNSLILLFAVSNHTFLIPNDTAEDATAQFYNSWLRN